MNIKEQYKKNILAIYGHEPRDLDDLAHCVIKMLNSYRDRNKNLLKVTGFSWDIYYSKTVSNSHSSPINGVTNWSGNKLNAPLSYPRWKGRVWLRMEKPFNGPTWDIFEWGFTYPGSGGSGGYDGPWKYNINGPSIYSWDYSIFCDDWPLVKASIEPEMMLDICENGRLTKKYEHKFLWEQPCVVEV